MTKEERLKIVNKLIKKISTTGRGFFETNGNTAAMILENGFVYFIDDYTKDKIFAYDNHKYFRNGFSHGGTLEALVKEFSVFIRTGKKVNGTNGYGGLYCDYWGYEPSEMKEIQDYAVKIGYL